MISVRGTRYPRNGTPVGNHCCTSQGLGETIWDDFAWYRLDFDPITFSHCKATGCRNRYALYLKFVAAPHRWTRVLFTVIICNGHWHINNNNTVIRTIPTDSLKELNRETLPAAISARHRTVVFYRSGLLSSEREKRGKASCHIGVRPNRCFVRSAISVRNLRRSRIGYGSKLEYLEKKKIKRNSRVQLSKFKNSECKNGQWSVPF